MAGESTYAQQWLRKLPLRWTRNAAIFGLLLVFGQMGGSVSWSRVLSNGIDTALLLFRFAVVAGIFALIALLIALVARWSLRLAMQLGPDVALRSVLPRWIIGAIACGILLLLTDLLFRWRKLNHNFGEDVAGDVAYLLGVVSMAAVIGLITGLVSRRGLSRAIEIDKEISSRHA